MLIYAFLQINNAGPVKYCIRILTFEITQFHILTHRALKTKYSGRSGYKYFVCLLKLHSHMRGAVAERRRADFYIPPPLLRVCSHIRQADAGGFKDLSMMYRAF